MSQRSPRALRFISGRYSFNNTPEGDYPLIRTPEAVHLTLTLLSPSRPGPENDLVRPRYRDRLMPAITVVTKGRTINTTGGGNSPPSIGSKSFMGAS